MTSFRLWRSIARAAIEDPIFRRISQIDRPAQSPKGRLRAPRMLIALAGLALAAAVLHSPALLIALFVLPILMITLMVASPVLLPLYVWIAGIQLTAEVIGGIYREKRQYTYDLICASTRGALDASWAFAVGILYGRGWFAPLRWGTGATSRAGLALLGSLAVFAFFAAISSEGVFGFEQARLLLLLTLLLALYSSNMTQSLVLSLVCGLFSSSFDISRQDAVFIGLFAYLTLSLLPVLAGGLVLAVFGRLAVELEPAARMLAEGGALLLVVVLREAGIALLWSALRRRLEWGRESRAARSSGWIFIGGKSSWA